MIVYQQPKESFMMDVRENRIDDVLYQNFINKLGRKTSPNEVNSWRNSLQYMRNVLDDQNIPSDALISIECQIPNTSKRIDFIISGQDQTRRDCAVVVELKQWETAQRTDMDGIVRAFVGGATREVSHPSYQAWSYVTLLQGFNEEVYENDIHLQPCAFLHNCEAAGDLGTEFYAKYLEKAPLFLRKDVVALARFIRQFVKFGDSKNIMYRIEKGRIRPSRTLADSVARMMQGNEEFVMIDDQKVVFEQALSLVKNPGRKKSVMIVKGGPGTGKSVVAVQLTAQLTIQRKLVQFVSKNRWKPVTSTWR